MIMSPHYHKLFNSAKIKPQDIKCKSDLQKIPLTTKEDVQRNFFAIIARGIDLSKCHTLSTTGSTGKPLKIFCNNAFADHLTALWIYPFLECGLHLRDTLIHIYALRGKPYIEPSFSTCLLMKKGEISLYNPISQNIKILKKIKPDALYTFPSALALIAKSVIKERIYEIQPKLIFTTGETVNQHHRKLIQKAFNVDINDIYGSTEFGRLAFECNQHEGLHILPDCILEFLKDGETVNFEEEGEIVITGLYNYVMPLIRYKIGDMGVPINERCNCGRNFPLIEKVIGRVDDYLVLPNGTTISPRNINVLENVPGILQYQTIQEKLDRFVVKVVKGAGFGEESINQIKEIIKAGCLGENVTVDVKIVDKIPKEGTGKLRTVISKVKKPQIVR